ncbi:MAG: hypothetical protein CMO61_04875 [Verrucomicrobiales bacterium]|nr:hypothetical protein [Verrucomicrobiales bacterium]|tara:strand:- start:1387 stop:3483 length:2097 start_codon:yes stop_codon:yes gene_type:complete
MPIFAAVIFLSAFLLFQVQPVIARYILPWYGGSPAVWTTCLLFFQCGLLGGYAYAHGLVTLLREKRALQVGIHLGLLALSLYFIPITPDDALRPDSVSENPVGGILKLLSLTVGFPYLLLSASGPLLQHWFAEIYPGKSPYRLYAISNVGSILGLLTYPFVFEPLMGVTHQTMLWSVAFAVYGIGAIACGITFFKKAKTTTPSEIPADQGEERPFRILDCILWIAFAACGSMLLLSLTNQMCQDVAVVPFLWVLPLALYLLTFVITFDHSRWYKRWAAIPLTIAAVGAVVYLIKQQFAWEEMHIGWQITIYMGAIFFGCLVCHGEVVRIKPPARNLTAFYLAISLGGALGGIFVSLISPLIFDGYWELHLSLVFLAFLISFQLIYQLKEKRTSRIFITGSIGWTGLIAALLWGLNAHIKETKLGSRDSARGFYGVLRVYDVDQYSSDYFRALYHGRISHGRQYIDEELSKIAPTYYSERSGVGAFFSSYSSRVQPKPMHVGVVGLGIGTISAYMRPEDRIRFYEINPQVEDLAREHFSYLSDCQGDEAVVLGDARISMENEWRDGGSQEFDILLIDAFSGDSIPIHLLTVEALELYDKHLKEKGVIAVHVSNLHLNLSDLVHNLANQTGWKATRVEFDPNYEQHMLYYSDWILLSKDNSFHNALEQDGYSSYWYDALPKDLIWTDDYSNLFGVIDWED